MKIILPYSLHQEKGLVDGDFGALVYTWHIVTLLRAFAHVFIPHEHNEYKPHILREFSVVLIIAISIFLLGFSAGSSYLIKHTVLGTNIATSVLIDLTNESRLAYNQPPLVRNEKLDIAAELKANDMATYEYFSHASPQGVTPWYWFERAGYEFIYAGENLAINFIDAQAIRDAWLASPAHRENLLDRKFKEIGMAAVPGSYKGNSTMYVVQMFGTPAKLAVETTSKAGVSSAQETRVLGESARSSNLAPAPQIKGDQARSEWWMEPGATTSQFIALGTTNQVKEDSASPSYSQWYERLLFGGTHYADVLFKGLFMLLVFALMTMIFIEVRREHWKHIAYALALLLITSLCIIINQTFW